MASKLVEFYLRFRPWWLDFFTEEAMEYMASESSGFNADEFKEGKIRLVYDSKFLAVWIPADKKYTLDELKELWKGADIDEDFKKEVLDNIYSCD